MCVLCFLLSCGLVPLLSALASGLAPRRLGRADALREYHKTFRGCGLYSFRIDWRFCSENSVRWFSGHHNHSNAASIRAARLCYNSKIIQGVAIFNEFNELVDYVTPNRKTL